MCEEVKNPETEVPRAMLLTVCLNTLAGLLILVPICFVLPDIQELIALPWGQPLPYIIMSATGSAGGTFALLVPLLLLAILCGTGCSTVASRVIWAFARDGAVPYAKHWSKISPTMHIPVNAMILSTSVQILLGLIYFGSTAAFNAFSGVGVICLTASYATPITISLVRGRKEVKTGKFYFGSFGACCNVVAVGTCTLILNLTAIFYLSLCLGRQPGHSWPCLCSACPPTFQSQPRRLTTDLWCLLLRLCFLLSGTGAGVMRTTSGRPLVIWNSSQSDRLKAQHE